MLLWPLGNDLINSERWSLIFETYHKMSYVENSSNYKLARNHMSASKPTLQSRIIWSVGLYKPKTVYSTIVANHIGSRTPSAYPLIPGVSNHLNEGHLNLSKNRAVIYHFGDGCILSIKFDLLPLPAFMTQTYTTPFLSFFPLRVWILSQICQSHCILTDTSGYELLEVVSPFCTYQGVFCCCWRNKLTMSLRLVDDD